MGKPFVLEEWGKQWSEEQRNQMFQLVQVSLVFKTDTLQ